MHALQGEGFLKLPNDNCDGLFDTFDNDSKVVSPKIGNFLDRYINCECGFHVNHIFRASVCDSKSAKRTFVFQKVGMKGIGESKPSWRHRLKSSCSFIGNGRHNVKRPMSVLSGAVMEEPEIISDSFIRSSLSFSSIVRLYEFNPLPELTREWKFTESCAAEIALPDGKFHSIFVGGRVGRGEHSHFVGHAVQSRPQLVEILAQYEREIISNGMSPHYVDDSCPIILRLYEKGIGIIVKESAEGIYESLSMSLRPFDSEPSFFE